MNEEDKNRRIQQMCNFIIQEAKEKVNEIKLKTENDFALEKQMLVHNARVKLQQEFKQAEKNIETQRRIAAAKSETKKKHQLLIERDNIMQVVKQAALTKLESVFQSNDEYKKALKNLIIQGLIKLDERAVTVMCRPEDESLINEIKGEAADEYKALIKDFADVDTKVELSVKTSDKCKSGGVKLITHGGKLVLDNTLESRTEISFEEMMPKLRKSLFSAA